MNRYVPIELIDLDGIKKIWREKKKILWMKEQRSRMHVSIQVSIDQGSLNRIENKAARFNGIALSIPV